MNQTKQALQIKTLQFINPQAFKQLQERKNRSTTTISSKSKQLDSTLIKRFKSGRLLRKTIATTPKIQDKDGQQEAPQRIHQNIESRRLCKSQNGKRSIKLKSSSTSSPQSSRKFIRSQTVCRYEPTQSDEDQNISFVINYSQEGQKKKRRPFATSSDIPQNRMRTDPTQLIDLKDQMMKRVAKKIDFMKLMTITDDKMQIKKGLSEKGEKKDSLFKFDKFYDHCVKNINKCLNTYDKNLNKQKDRKYYQLKVQGTILQRELKEIRQILLSKRPKEAPQQTNNMGIVGSNIDVRTSEKMQNYRTNGSHYKKKLKKANINLQQTKNPFKMDNMQGWEIGLERTEDFYL